MHFVRASTNALNSVFLVTSGVQLSSVRCSIVYIKSFSLSIVWPRLGQKCAIYWITLGSWSPFNCSNSFLYFLFSFKLIPLRLCQEIESSAELWRWSYFRIFVGSRHRAWRSKACAWLILLSSLWISWVESSPFDDHFIDDNSYFWRGVDIDQLIRQLSLRWILKSEQANSSVSLQKFCNSLLAHLCPPHWMASGEWLTALRLCSFDYPA